MTTEPNNPDSAADSNKPASDTSTTETASTPILETLDKCSQLTQMLQQQEGSDTTQKAIPYPQLSGPSQNATPAQLTPTHVPTNMLRAEFCHLDVTQETLAGLAPGPMQPGLFLLLVSLWAAGGPTTNWVGAAGGFGIRLRMLPSCHGWWVQP